MTGDWTKGEDPDDWQCWQTEVRATAIVNGEEVHGSAYLAGTWERYGDMPWESNPDISGYERQMTQEALEELGKRAPFSLILISQIEQAMAVLEEWKEAA